MTKKQSVRKIVSICLILVLTLVILYSGLRILESTVFSGEEGQEEQITSKTIIRNGVAYYPRQDIKTMLVMGIDERGPVKDSGLNTNTGEVDMLALLIFDEKNEQIDVLCLNRDTMLEMPVLGIDGKAAGTRFAQLALSHVYGSGLEDSCENTKKTVSNFLYGISVDYYVAMNMDAIAILNDAVGGVTVEVTEDFSEAATPIPMGTQTLTGEQALTFVQVRKDVGDQKNVSRMERQEAYIRGFMEAFRKVNGDETFVLDAYGKVEQYMVTDCSAKSMSSMMSRYREYDIREFATPEGENRVGQKFMEFYVDEEALDALLLRLLYAPK